MTILTRGQIYKQWLLTILLGSLAYTALFGAEMTGKLFAKFTFLEKVHSYLRCLLTTLFYSFIAGGAALYLNRLIYYLISCESSIKSRFNWLIFLLFPTLVSTVIYCVAFPFISHGETSYMQLALQAASFLLPWILSALAVTVLLNLQLPSEDDLA